MKVKRPQYKASKEAEYDIDSLYEDENGRDMDQDGDSEDDDDMKSISFGALSKAQKSIEREQRYEEHDDEIEDSDSAPEEASFSSANTTHKRRSKHAPAESSYKKPVSWIREIPGLQAKKTSSLHRDIRFDAAYGKSDLTQTRKNYAFLNEYRESELEEMIKMKKKTKDENERNKLETAIQALQSRLKTFKDRDFEREVLAKHTKEARKNNYHLKRSEMKKIVLTEKYNSMKKKDVNRALERRRKKNASKERKQMPLERRVE